ncbi:MAG: tetratricopeptide repeat protein [Sterolibacteriaceae bacterium]|nr:tetratricopeptide repeat protein [Sterolibacteriaceae bacterium]MBK9083801.1 tetratricopeptide repeat protein [Sterolibacteriaceae bacterium]
MRTHLFQRPFQRLLPRLLPLAASITFAFGMLGAAPAHADALSEAQTLLKQGQLQPALERVDQYLATKPKDAQGRFLRGLVLTELNRPAEAIGVFTKLTEDYPELPEPFNNLAVIYAQQKQYDKAKVALEMAIRTHPSYATAHENLGDIYARLASQAYDKALQLDSNNATAQNKLAMMRDLMSLAGRAGARPPATVVAAATPAAPAAAPAPAAKPAPAPVAAAPAPVSVPTPAPVAKPAAPVPVAVAPPTAPPAPAAKAADSKPAVETAATAGVSKAVDQWAKAWSAKDIKAYLAQYGADFRPPGGTSRGAWEQERTARVTKPGKIDVDIEDLAVEIDGDKATAQFRQHYRSANLNSSTGKTLVLTRHGDKWQIQQERIGR